MEEPFEIKSLQDISNVLVFDFGAGFTKVGVGGNVDPTVVFSSLIDGKCSVQRGIIQDWDLQDKLIAKALKELKIEHLKGRKVLILDSPLNTDEKREKLRKIFVEKYQAGLVAYFDQMIASLAASWKDTFALVRSETGVVVDIGQDYTLIAPVVDFFVRKAAIKTLPFGGDSVTDFIASWLSFRNEPIPSKDIRKAAEEAKMQGGLFYLCPNVIGELKRYDDSPDSYFRKFDNGRWIFDLGYERFLGPELFFCPEIIDKDLNFNIAALIDDAIQSCSFTVRRQLYKNIVFCGGSSKFKDFNRRLSRDVKDIVNLRLGKSNDVEVRVVVPFGVSGTAAWYGGSVLASSPVFHSFATADFNHSRRVEDEDDIANSTTPSAFSMALFSNTLNGLSVSGGMMTTVLGSITLPKPKRYHLFAAHAWGKDHSNHKHVQLMVDELVSLGLEVWFDENRLSGEIDRQITQGLEQSVAFAPFITMEYMEKVEKAGERDGIDWCDFEYTAAMNSHGRRKTVVVVGDKQLLDKTKWFGRVKALLGGLLYIDYSDRSKLKNAAMQIRDRVKEIVDSDKD